MWNHWLLLQHNFCWNTTRKENLECAFWAPEFGYPNQYTSLENALNTSLIGKDKIWGDNEVKLLETTINNSLKFDIQISNICTKANQELSILSRMRNILNFEQRRRIFKIFFKSQFKYCLLIWMFCSGKGNNKINKLHERALRIAIKMKFWILKSYLEKPIFLNSPSKYPNFI